MTPSPYEIYEARVRLNAANYSRPCLVINLEFQGKIAVFPISSKMELYRGPQFHFKISSTDPDFAKTGLTVDSYVVGERVVDVELCDFVRKRGQLEGELLARFKKWFQ